MPWSICPICGRQGHYTIRGETSEEWARRTSRAEGYEPSDRLTARIRCFFCWVDLKEGHRVKIRAVPSKYFGQLSEDQEGVVKVPENEAGFILVEFDCLIAELQRQDLWYVPENRTLYP